VLDFESLIQGLLGLHSRYGPPDRSAALRRAFVARLQPFRLPDRAAPQLPDQSTTLWVDSSSTGDSRLRGAQPLQTSLEFLKEHRFQFGSAYDDKENSCCLFAVLSGR
jgi:hypothetical protein